MPDSRDAPTLGPPAAGTAPLVAGAILAGGRATRFGGRDKSALRLGAARILDRQLDALGQVADEVLIVTSDPARYASLGVRVVPDAVADGGALGGLYTALLASSAPQAVVVAGDMPFLTTAFLAYLVRAGRDVDIAIPRTRTGYEPLCASYARSCLAPIRSRLAEGALKVAGLVDAGLRVRELTPEELAPFETAAGLFFNVNTPDDYAAAVRTFRLQNE